MKNRYNTNHTVLIDKYTFIMMKGMVKPTKFYCKHFIWCKPGGKLVLITNRKSHMGFRLVPKSVTLNDLERRNGHYFALFRRIR